MTQELRTEDRLRAAAVEFVVITGLSGAGRSEAAKVLEDLGYFVIDNLPPSLIGRVAELAVVGRDPTRVALVMDARGGAFTADVSELSTALDQLRAQDINLRVLFLEASDEVLIRRFEATRRRHPVAGERVAESIALERDLLRELRADADLVLDTSDLNVHELRAKILAAFADEAAGLLVTVASFGFKYGLPLDADMVVDVRFLPNPHWVPELRPLPGTDPAVRDYVLAQDGTGLFLARLEALLETALPGYVQEGKQYLTVAIGCTGGKHRSVVLAERAGRLADRQGLPGPRRPPGRGARVRVVALGGGHGLAVTLTALRLLGVEPTAIVAVADDGGSSGRLRRDLGLLPPGDLRKAMLALADPTAEVRELFGYRFERGDLAGHNLGNLALAALTDLKGGFQEALEEASRWLRVHGQVLPATLVPVRLCGRVDGRAVEGQVAIRHGQRPGRVGLAGAGPSRRRCRPRSAPSARPTWSCSAPARPSPRWCPTCSSPSWPTALTEAPSGWSTSATWRPSRGRPPASRPRATWPRSSTTAPACRWRPCSASGPGTPPAPPGSCEAFAELGAAVVHAEVAADDHPGRHDAARLATALKELA